MKFAVLYFVASLNLILGYVLVRRWRLALTRSASDDFQVPCHASEEHASTTPDEALQQLRQELAAQTGYFESQLNALSAEGLSASSLEELAGEFDVAVQRLLQTLTAASDILAQDDGQTWHSEVGKLEQYWAEISDATLPLVTMAFDEATGTATQEQLMQICQHVQQRCSEAQRAICDWQFADREEK